MKIPAIRSPRSTASEKQTGRVIAAVAVEASGRGATGAIVDEGGDLLVERRIEFSRPAVRAVAAATAKLIVDLAGTEERGNREIASIGVSVPGYVHPEDGRVTIPRRSLAWNRVPLKESIRTELGAGPRSLWAKIPLVVSGRSAACVAAEAWTGAARGQPNVVFVSIEDEIEAGLMVDGRIIRGSAGRAGAAGWFALSEQFRKEFEDAGCLTVEAGRGAVVRRTIESWTDEKNSLVGGLSVSNPSDISAEILLRAARGGDRLASKVVGDLCSWIGRGIADLISMLNPEVVVVGGEFGIALKPFLGELRREARRWAEPGSGRQCRIVSAGLGREGALIGAARIAMQGPD